MHARCFLLPFGHLPANNCRFAEHLRNLQVQVIGHSNPTSFGYLRHSLDAVFHACSLFKSQPGALGHSKGRAQKLHEYWLATLQINRHFKHANNSKHKKSIFCTTLLKYNIKLLEKSSVRFKAPLFNLPPSDGVFASSTFLLDSILSEIKYQFNFKEFFSSKNGLT